MKFRSHRPRLIPTLRNRLYTLVLIAFLPAVLGLTVDAFLSRKKAIDEAHEKNRQEVILAASTQKKHIGYIEEILAGIAFTEGSASLDASACAARFAKRYSKLHNFANVGLLDENGYVVCSALPNKPAQSFAERSYFSEIRESRGLAVSEVLVGGISRHQSIIFGYPVEDASGAFRGVVFATLREGRFANLPLSAEKGITSRFTFFDRHGRYIASDPGDSIPIERQLSLQQMNLVRQGGNVPLLHEMVSGDGGKYLAALLPIKAPHGTAAYVRALISEDEVLASWRASVVRRAVVVLMTLVCALALAWCFLEKWIVRDLLRLVDFTKAARGNVIPPSHENWQTAETALAMRAVADMAAALHGQRERLAEMHEQANAANAELERRVEQRTKDLERSEQMVRTLAEAIPQMVWIGTVEEGVTYVNKSWAAALGHSETEPLGHNWLECFHPDDKKRAMECWVRAVEDKDQFAGQFRLRDDSGEYRYYILKGAPLPSEDERADLWVGVGTDISELKQAEENLMLANNELQSFSYSVSHDLKAPLRAINGFSSVLLSDFADDLDVQARHYLERIRGSTQHMSALVDDLLKLAQLSVMESNRSQTDLSAICARIIARLREIDPSRVVLVEIEPGMDVFADARLLEIALTNLLDNAWKFTRDVPIAFIQVGRTQQNGSTVYSIRDNGVGFDMRYAERLFGVFQRLHSSKDYPGTGIGLATAKRVIAQHGGKIWAESCPREGATFFFTIQQRST